MATHIYFRTLKVSIIVHIRVRAEVSMLLKTGVVVPVPSIRKVLQPGRNISPISQEMGIKTGHSVLALTLTFHLLQLRHILCINGFHKIRDTSEDEIALFRMCPMLPELMNFTHIA